MPRPTRPARPAPRMGPPAGLTPAPSPLGTPREPSAPRRGAGSAPSRRRSDGRGGCGALSRRSDAVGLVGVEQPKVGVGERGGGLDPSEPARNGCGNRLAGDGEVVDRLPGLAAPELLLRPGTAHAFESS